MGTQSNDRGGENRQPQQPGRADKQDESQKQAQGGPQDPKRQAQDQDDPQRRNMASDDDVGGDVDAHGEVTPPTQTGNQDRERTGPTGPRNP
jgi:hypothetical protein